MKVSFTCTGKKITSVVCTLLASYFYFLCVLRNQYCKTKQKSNTQYTQSHVVIHLGFTHTRYMYKCHTMVCLHDVRKYGISTCIMCSVRVYECTYMYVTYAESVILFLCYWLCMWSVSAYCLMKAAVVCVTRLVRLLHS